MNQKSSMCRLLSSGFYFSYNYDLTHSIEKKPREGNLHEKADKSFYKQVKQAIKSLDALVKSIDSNETGNKDDAQEEKE